MASRNIGESVLNASNKLSGQRHFTDLFISVYCQDMRQRWVIYLLTTGILGAAFLPDPHKSSASTGAMFGLFFILPIARGLIFATVRKLKRPPLNGTLV